MTRRRIIPCLDIRDGRVVKGVRFDEIRDVASPGQLADFYDTSGADELVLYDITASLEGRTLFMDILEDIAKKVRIPLVVGGGISSIEDIRRVLDAGGHKISINTAAIENPPLVEMAAKALGSSRLVLSMDVKRVDGAFRVFKKGGRENTGMDALEWARMGQERGAGELVVNSIDTDGVRGGFDMEMLTAVTQEVSIPIIASGGAGKMEDFVEVFQNPGIGAGLAASIFHRGEIDLRELKLYLRGRGIPVHIGGLKA